MINRTWFIIQLLLDESVLNVVATPKDRHNVVMKTWIVDKLLVSNDIDDDVVIVKYLLPKT